MVEALTSIEDSSLSDVFDDQSALMKLQTLYRELHVNTRHKMDNLIKNNSELLNLLNQKTAEQALQAVQQETLSKLHKNEIITGKLFIMLRRELTAQNRAK